MVKRIFLNLSRWSTWRRVLLRSLFGGISLVLLLTLFYWEEDWRGARAWAAVERDLKAQGESLDYQALIPPPIPDDQNFAVQPAFAQWSKKSPSSVGLLRPFDAGTENFLYIQKNKHEGGDVADTEKEIFVRYHKKFPEESLSLDPLTAVEKTWPILFDLYQADERPLCRYPSDVDFPAFLEAGHTELTKVLRLNYLLNLHAFIALAENKPTLALRDFRVSHKMLSGLEPEPLFISGLILCDGLGQNNWLFKQSLAQHPWNESQLNDLDAEFQQYDLLLCVQRQIKGDALIYFCRCMDYLKTLSPEQLKTYLNLTDPADSLVFSIPWPSGWYDLNKSELVPIDFSVIKGVDPALHRAYPERIAVLEDKLTKDGKAWGGFDIWNFFYWTNAHNTIYLTKWFAKAQTQLDQAHIACALERYWLHHQVYPAHLEDLTAAEAPTPLPRDVMTGEPYRYRLKTDGTYVLYSVGWDQHDDGGVSQNYTQSIDTEKTDWVW